MYGFGVENEQGEPQAPAGAAPKWFRERMDEVSETLKELRAENDRLKAEQAKRAVQEALTAQGYAPQVADLYTGKPEGLNDWLGTYGAGLAKVGGEAAAEAGQGVQGTPQTVVSPEDQAALERMAAAGQGGAPALAGDAQLAARVAAAKTLEELEAIEREQGSRYLR